jgi:hypothetical protein
MEPANATSNSAARTRAAAAEHIAVEASRLVRIAKANEFSLLAYLIDMAVLEAWREAGEAGPAPAPIEDSQPAHESG